eukprot:g6202.t1
MWNGLLFCLVYMSMPPLEGNGALVRGILCGQLTRWVIVVVAAELCSSSAWFLAMAACFYMRYLRDWFVVTCLPHSSRGMPLHELERRRRDWAAQRPMHVAERHKHSYRGQQLAARKERAAEKRAEKEARRRREEQLVRERAAAKAAAQQEKAAAAEAQRRRSAEAEKLRLEREAERRAKNRCQVKASVGDAQVCPALIWACGTSTGSSGGGGDVDCSDIPDGTCTSRANVAFDRYWVAAGKTAAACCFGDADGVSNCKAATVMAEPAATTGTTTPRKLLQS